jgi:tetratricopeptide (TPR) repeat protein
MRWAYPEPFAGTVEQKATTSETIEEPTTAEPADARTRRRRSPAARPTTARRERSTSNGLPALPTMVMTDLLIFFTFVFIYTTNSLGSRNGIEVLFKSVTTRVVNGQAIDSPALLLLMLFTWAICATLGLAAESLRQRRAPDLGWWLRGYLIHGVIIWLGWLIYGMVQGGRLAVGAGGNTLEEQLNQVAGHFAVYTTLLVLWIVAAGTVYAWPTLRARGIPAATRPALSLAAGVVVAIAVFAIISSVNVELVKADIIYKQGQQFDNQQQWVSSIELYRRALLARKTEDYYMLFLGRALLEQAKQAQPEGVAKLSETPTVDEVLALTPEQVSQMGRFDLLRAAETILREAQRVNPLNTDHTANLARLYRSWSDISGDNAQMRQEMLDKSIAQYNMAVTLSPNAAHLWNEKGNTHLARGENDQAEQAYLHSLGLDPLYEQTYLLLAEYYDNGQQFDKIVAIFKKGIQQMQASGRIYPTAAMYSYYSVAQARTGDLAGAIESNLTILKMQPNNAGAMRNLALLYRDSKNDAEAVKWLEQAISATPQDRTTDLVQLNQLAGEIYQSLNQADQAIAKYEQVRQLSPNDTNALKALSNLYNLQKNDGKVAEIVQSLIKLEPTSYEHPLQLAQVLQRAGQKANALKFAQQALSLAPDDKKAAVNQLIDSLK